MALTKTMVESNTRNKIFKNVKDLYRYYVVHILKHVCGTMGHSTQMEELSLMPA